MIVNLCRCRYLEEAGCASICINSCKVPTQVQSVRNSSLIHKHAKLICGAHTPNGTWCFLLACSQVTWCPWHASARLCQRAPLVVQDCVSVLRPLVKFSWWYKRHQHWPDPSYCDMNAGVLSGRHGLDAYNDAKLRRFLVSI